MNAEHAGFGYQYEGLIREATFHVYVLSFYIWAMEGAGYMGLSRLTLIVIPGFIFGSILIHEKPFRTH